MLPPFVEKPRRVWLLWHKAKSIGATPSSLVGVEQGTYSAYCLDEAVIYFGLVLEARLDEAGHKPSKEERRAKAARDRVLQRVLGEVEENSGSGYADPATMFF